MAVIGKSPAVRSNGIYAVGNTFTGGQSGMTITAHVWASAFVANYLLGNSAKPIYADGSKDSTFMLRSNACMNVSPNGRLTFTNATSITKLNVAVAGLPIQAIHATWDVVPVSTVRNSVLGARYNGLTVYFYNSSALLGSNSFWYTVEV